MRQYTVSLPTGELVNFTINANLDKMTVDEKATLIKKLTHMYPKKHDWGTLRTDRKTVTIKLWRYQLCV